MIKLGLGRAAIGLVGLVLASSCTGEISGGSEEVVGNSSATLTINVNDGFESGNLAAGGWTGTGDVVVTSAGARTGGFGARLGRTGVITTSIDTTGFQNIQVAFDWRTTALDWFEFATVEYLIPGGSPTVLGTTATTTWATQTFSLPAAADNRAGVQLRFWVSATAFFESSWEGLDVDNVIVRGTPIAPPECTSDAGCAAGRICQAGMCVPHCGDGVRNGNETAVDCGGACPACSTTVAIFTEDFDSGLSRFTLDPASRVTTITGFAAHQNGPSALLTVTASMTTTVATTGFDNLVLKYVRGTSGLDSGEYLQAEVSVDGVSYTQVERVQTASLGPVSFALPATFANRPALRIRFRAQGSFFFLFPETAVVDAIVLEGRPTAPGCTSDAQCSSLDGACVRGACTAGTCTAVNRAEGTACGSSTSTQCDAPDTCNGAGACVTNLAAAGTACGDATATQCNQRDTCDGAGACNPRLLAAGTACGSSASTPCDQPDTCNGSGVCQVNLRPIGTSCGAAGSVCDSGTCVDCGSANPTSTFDLIQTSIFDGYGCTDSVCHGATASGSLDLRAPASYSHLFEVQAAGSAMDRVAPNDPDNSYLYRKLAWATNGIPVEGGGPMPASGAPITIDELAGVQAWIEGGAPQSGLVPGSLVAGLCEAPCTSNADCSDGNACNGVEVCSAGACVPGTAPNCNDGVACTEDRCDPVAGCRNVLTAGLPCAGGVCDASGACVGCTPPANTYDAIQTLVFDSPVYGCRNGPCHGATMQGGLDLSPASSYSELLNERSRVVPGNLSMSRLYDKLQARINGTTPVMGGSPMPQAPYPAITSSLLSGIGGWINGGAPRTGVVPGTESSLCYPVTAPPANLTQLWQSTGMEGVTGRMVVSGDVIYVTSWNGYVYALNKNTGAQIWSYNTSSPAVHGGVAIAPDGSLVVGDGNAVVRRLNASTGVPIWTRDLDQTNADHIWQAVTIHNDRIYVPIASHSDAPCTKGRVMAIRLSDGGDVWTHHNVPGRICNSDTNVACTSNAQCPNGGTCVEALGGSVTGRIQVDPDGQSIYLNTVGCYTFPSVLDSDTIMKLNASTGAEIWKFRTNAVEQFKYCIGNGSGGSGLPAGSDCRTNGECRSGWCGNKTFFYDFGFINGPHYVMARTEIGGTRPLIVSASKNGTVYARNAGDGSEAWTTTILPAPISPNFAGYGLFNGAMAYMNGKFYAAAYKFSPEFTPAPDHLWAFSEVDGSIVWSDDIGISWSSVGAANGTVYTGTQASSTLYAYNGETGARLNSWSLPASSAGEPVVDGNMLFVPYGFDGTGGVRAYRIDP